MLNLDEKLDQEQIHKEEINLLRTKQQYIFNCAHLQCHPFNNPPDIERLKYQFIREMRKLALAHGHSTPDKNSIPSGYESPSFITCAINFTTQELDQIQSWERERRDLLKEKRAVAKDKQDFNWALNDTTQDLYDKVWELQNPPIVLQSVETMKLKLEQDKEKRKARENEPQIGLGQFLPLHIIQCFRMSLAPHILPEDPKCAETLYFLHLSERMNYAKSHGLLLPNGKLAQEHLPARAPPQIPFNLTPDQLLLAKNIRTQEYERIAALKEQQGHVQSPDNRKAINELRNKVVKNVFNKLTILFLPLEEGTTSLHILIPRINEMNAQFEKLRFDFEQQISDLEKQKRADIAIISQTIYPLPHEQQTEINQCVSFYDNETRKSYQNHHNTLVETYKKFATYSDIAEHYVRIVLEFIPME